MSEENTSTYENIEEENSIGHVQIAGEVIEIGRASCRERV